MINIDFFKEIPRRQLYILLVGGAVIGVIGFVAIRVALFDTSSTHHHANFAVFINGKRENFEEAIFYEEVSSCGVKSDDPLSRVHMHDMISDVVHVHDGSATWGNFFENIGFTLGDRVLYARTNTYQDGRGGELMFMLNGRLVQTITNKNITSEDTLLISFDQDDTVLSQQYTNIVESASEYNETADPSTCSGSDTPETIWERTKAVIGF